MVGGQKKHVFGSEGTVAGMGWQTYALRVGVLICSIYQSYQIYIMFHKSEACVQRLVYENVGDFAALTYQFTQRLKRATTLYITTVSPIFYIHCVCPA